MATSPAPPAEPRPQAVTKVVEYEDFVDQRIQQTRAAVKTADLATGVVTLLAWTLFVLLLSAVADHWLVAGGFTRVGRFALFAVGAIGGLLYLATRLAPRLLGRVNPLYAAQEIEKESPQLKNSVLNLLQLRDHPASAAAVRQTLERQAAERLASAGEAPIDRTPLVRAAKFVLALVAAIGVYVVASPKDFFASAGRVLAPWADIAAPSRVRFDEVTPGDLEIAQGERLEIGSMVSGLRDDEIVEVVFTTSDGSAVERRTPMRASESGVHHTAALPPGGGASAALGLQGDLFYRLEAGDARTRNHRVTVIAAPTIAPTSIRYEYPEYTGYVDREVEGTGDLRAIEGTRVTLTARANLPIESAQIDLDADGRPDVRMRSEGEEATGSLTLRRDPNETGDTATSYVLRFTATDGQANHDPPQYRVEVIADLAPEIEKVTPGEDRTRVRADERVVFETIARDPDFALLRLRLVGETRGRRVLEQDLLHGDGRGKVEGQATVVPEQIGLQPGETLDYWIEAADNRTPEANQTVSPRRQLQIVGPAEENQQAGDERGGEGGAGSPDGGDPQQDPTQQPNQPGQPNAQGGPRQPQDNPDTGDDPSGENQPGQNPNEKPQEEEQEGEGRKPSPGGLRAPGEGGDSGEKQGDPTAGQNPGGDDSESGDESNPGGAAGSPPEAGEQTPSDRNQPDGQPGEQQQPNGGNPDGAEPNDASEEGAGGADAPTARDGSDDGSAFEKMLDYLKNQQENGAGEPQDGADQPSDPGEDPGQKDGQTGQEKPSEGDQGEAGEGEPNETGSDAGQSPDPADNGAGGSQDSAAEGTDSQGASRGDPRDGAAPDQADRSEEGPGAGEEDRQGDASDSTNSESGGESSPGQESDPRAGPREGTGDSGQNQAADQGAGRSGDEGAGESTGESSGQEESDGSTGGQQDNSRTGQGEKDPGNPGEESPGGQPSEDSTQESGDKNRSSDKGSRDPSSDGQSGADGDPAESGEGPDSPIDRRGEGPDSPAGDNAGDPVGIGDRGPNPSGAGAGSEPGGDAANLDYARKQTDLVLNQLEDQLRKKQVDPELLDRLGWTEQDLRRFLERWQSRRRQAAQRGPEGEAELDRALRSLGIRPEGPTATRSITAERLKELRQRARQQAPPRLREQLELYNRSLNAAPTSDE